MWTSLSLARTRILHCLSRSVLQHCMWAGVPCVPPKDWGCGFGSTSEKGGIKFVSLIFQANVLTTKLLWETKTTFVKAWNHPRKKSHSWIITALFKAHKLWGREGKTYPHSLCFSSPSKCGSILNDAALYTNVQRAFQSNTRYTGFFIVVFQIAMKYQLKNPIKQNKK